VGGQIEKVGHVHVGVAVRAPHELGADNPDVDLFAHDALLWFMLGKYVNITMS
jgi:hypothetical protein